MIINLWIMETYIAVLRGINVSGKNKLKMKEFAEVLQSNGLKNVKTYIQSGNIVFKHQQTTPAFFEELIHKIILDHFGYDVPVIAFNKAYLQGIISSNPFLNFPETDVTKLHVTFFAGEPDESAHETMLAANFSPDKIMRGNKAYYGYCPNGYGKTKFNNAFFEKKSRVSATTRNWKTCNMLLKMALE